MAAICLIRLDAAAKRDKISGVKSGIKDVENVLVESREKERSGDIVWITT